MAVYYKPQSPIQSGEDFIYPITTADQVMVDEDTRLNAVGVYLKNIDNSTDTTVYGNNATTLGGVAAEDYALKTDTAPDSSKLGGKAPEYYIQPRNLLDNSNFRNPVNQRGQTSYTGFAYTIDRWIIWSTTGTAKLEKANGYLFVNPNGESGCSISQRIPKGLVEQSKTYTKVLCHLDGSIEVSTAEIVYGDNYDLVDFHITSAANIIWAALYEGSYTADTLPPYVPKGYAVELAECQRYFQASDNPFFVGATSTGINYHGVLFFTPMRIVPTITVSSQNGVEVVAVSATRNGFVAKNDSSNTAQIIWNASADL